MATLTGCASRAYTKAATTSDTMAEAAAEAETARRQVDEANSALDALLSASPGDLRSSFERYRGAVAALEETAADLRSKTDEMEQKGERYFDAWDERTASIRNENIRNRSADRQREVSERFAEVRQSYLDARGKLAPLLARLNDIRALVGADLTVAGVNGAREFTTRVDGDASAARQALDTLAGRLRAMSGRLDPS